VEFVREQVIRSVPHRHLVFALPKVLRPAFRYRRRSRGSNFFLLQHVLRGVERSSWEMETADREIRLIFPSQLFILGYVVRIK
jgi:hypothetical protein